MIGKLRVGVPARLFELEPVGGHGKVWRRVLERLDSSLELIRLADDGRPLRRLRRRPQVILADGHAELPASDVPLVIQVHEAAWFDPQLRELLDPPFAQALAGWTASAVQAATAVICPSEVVRRELLGVYRLSPESVHAVHHGVDPVFTPDARGGSALVAEALGAGDTDVAYVLFGASLHPRKNLAAVRDAIAILSSEGLPRVLVIAGTPALDRSDSSELEAAARAELPGASGRVAYLGEVGDSQLAALMAEADAFCLPSLYEGFGLTALEAMACGAPVVVSDRGALPEVVGDAGVVVSEPSPEALARALGALLTDPVRAQALGAAAAARARSFTWERTAEGWLRVLRIAARES